MLTFHVVEKTEKSKDERETYIFMQIALLSFFVSCTLRNESISHNAGRKKPQTYLSASIVRNIIQSSLYIICRNLRFCNKIYKPARRKSLRTSIWENYENLFRRVFGLCIIFSLSEFCMDLFENCIRNSLLMQSFEFRVAVYFLIFCEGR